MAEEIEGDILAVSLSRFEPGMSRIRVYNFFILTYECTVWTKCGVPVILKQETRTVNHVLLRQFSPYDTDVVNVALLG
jgi:hypothetical protein